MFQTEDEYEAYKAALAARERELTAQLDAIAWWPCHDDYNDLMYELEALEAQQQECDRLARDLGLITIEDWSFLGRGQEPIFWP
jgi:hypothetical protein